MDYFFPAEPVSKLEPDPYFKQTGKKFIGNYRWTRGPYSTPAVINYLIEYKQVSIDNEGYLDVNGIKFVQVGELLFREPEYEFYLGFKEDVNGRITYMFYSHVPANALERLRGADNPPIAWGIITSILIIMLSSLAYVPARRWIKKEEKYVTETKIERFTKLTTLTTGWGIIGLVALYGGFSAILLISEAVFPVTRALLVIPYLIAISFLALVGLTISLWIKKQGSYQIKIVASMISIVSSIFIWWMIHWNMLGSFYV